MARNIVLIPHIPKEPHLVLPREHRQSQRMNRRVPVSFIVKPTTAIQMREVSLIRHISEEIQTRDLEIAEELAVVVLHTRVRVEQPVKIRLRVDQMRVLRDEVARDGPEGGEAAGVVEDGHVEAVDEVVLGEEAERVVGDLAEEMHVRLDAPVPVVGGEGGVVVKEAGLPADHRVVGEHVALADADGAQVVEGVHVFVSGDPVWCGPVRAWDDVVLGLGGGSVRGGCLQRGLLSVYIGWCHVIRACVFVEAQETRQ